MTSALDNLCGPDKPLRQEPFDEQEFNGLWRSGTSRLRDAGNADNSLDSRFALAYGAAHSLALAALRYRGYRPENRYIVFQTLPHTLGLGPEVWRMLSKCHDKRNVAEYEGTLDIDERLVSDLLTAALTVELALKEKADLD